MSSWADESEEHLEPAPAEYGGSGVRPRLQLQPRSKVTPQDSGSTGGGGSSIFGAAKPREAGELLITCLFFTGLLTYNFLSRCMQYSHPKVLIQLSLTSV